MYTKDPPDHTAEFMAANLLSCVGTMVEKCSRKSSGWFFRPSSMESKMTPCFSHSSRREWYTISDSYWAPTPARILRSASGIPSFSKVSLISWGTSSQECSMRSWGRT